jgi:hypothetical protein
MKGIKVILRKDGNGKGGYNEAGYTIPRHIVRKEKIKRLLCHLKDVK